VCVCVWVDVCLIDPGRDGTSGVVVVNVVVAL